jgi:hypothetical protein
MTSSKPIHRLFVGNPGVGKSALANSCAGKPLFLSGESKDGVGVTIELQRELVNGIEYMDTPGLSDPVRRQSAAAEIERALKTDGEFHLIFVVTLRAGRVNPDDLATIKVVLEALKNISPLRYNVVINDVPEKKRAELMSNEDQFALYQAKFAVGDHLPDDMFVYPRDAALEMQTNVVVPMRDDFREWLDQLDPIRIESAKVGKVNGESFDEAKERLAAESDELERELIQLTEKNREAESRLKQLAAQVQHQHQHRSRPWYKKIFCFDAGTTIVWRRAGDRWAATSVKDVRVGDIVATLDESGERIVPSDVCYTVRGPAPRTGVVQLQLESGGELRVTDAHLVWLENRNTFVMACDVRVGDVMRIVADNQACVATSAVRGIVRDAGTGELVTLFTVRGTVLANGVLASCYEHSHAVQRWTSIDTRLLYALFGRKYVDWPAAMTAIAWTDAIEEAITVGFH